MTIRPTRRDGLRRLSWPTWALIALALAAFVAWTYFNQLLAGCYLDGSTGSGIDGITSPVRVVKPDGAVEISQAWLSYASSAGRTQNVAALVRGTFVADLVLMSSLTAVLLFAHRRLAVPQRLFTVMAGCYWVADASETALASFGWAGLDLNGARLIGVFSLVKWISLAACLTVLVAHRPSAKSPRDRKP